MGNRLTGAAIRVEGYTELRKAFEALGPEMTAALKTLNITMADEIIADARARAGSRRMTARAATQLRPVRSALRGGVNLRATSAAPFAMGAEFGADRDRQRHRTGVHGASYVGYRQFQPWRGADASAGYFLWPAVRAEDVAGRYGDLLDQTIQAVVGDG